MSSLTHIFGEDARIRIECADDEPTIWIRSYCDSISLSLTRAQRAELRKAIDDADELDAPLPVVADTVAERHGGIPMRNMQTLSDDQGGRP